ncbi:hypothetical protein MYAER_2300 [Microcystis aeruginosa NIES-2549]|uniref:Uncharacterized protein n=1 Tax=Microcystis aeruginosa NIES-2549 TaxID=1641812 RepID=A0A0F6U544_MICAE|nr:hypothetical protein MYAER_2300 [Microcystis aeruginosa NIES-2549]AOC53042.1 hypothetical protein amyaer_2327 [Microcystis aeruginosa NIES-2481]
MLAKIPNVWVKIEGQKLQPVNDSTTTPLQPRRICPTW